MASPQATTHIHRLLDEHWTTVLGVEPSVWRDAEVVVASHPEPSHSDHVYLIRREDHCLLVVPEAQVGATTVACASWPSAAVFDKAFIRSLYGEAVRTISGPFWLGYATAESFRTVDGRGVRPLAGAEDGAALQRLLATVPPEEATDAGFHVTARREYGCFVDSALICAGTLTPFRGLPANVGVLTHPAHRGHGYGTAMVSTVTTAAFAAGSTAAQFRALFDNRPALRMARVLGFVEDALTLEVALQPAAETAPTG